MRVYHRSTVIALFLVALSGCNEIAGIHEPIDSDGGPNKGGGSEGGTASGDPFLGRWSARAGTQQIDCGAAGKNSGVSAAFEFVVSLNGATYAISEEQCTYPGAVSGAVLSLASGSTCSGTDPDTGRPGTITISEGTIKLGDLPNHADLILKGRLDTQDNNGLQLVCTFVQFHACERQP